MDLFDIARKGWWDDVGSLAADIVASSYKVRRQGVPALELDDATDGRRLKVLPSRP